MGAKISPSAGAATLVCVIVLVVSGTAILKGCNWARSLYCGWNVAEHAIEFTITTHKAAVIPGLFVFGVIVVLLYHPKTTEFFRLGEKKTQGRL